MLYIIRTLSPKLLTRTVSSFLLVPLPMRSSPLTAAAIILATLSHFAFAIPAPPDSPASATPPAAAAPASGPESLVSQDRLLATLRALPTKRSANGSPEHRAGLRATEELLLTQLRELGYQPTTHEFDFLGSSREARSDPDAPAKPWRNIIFEIPGKSVPNEILVFAAHFDAVPAAPGADDNGTGVAAILEMARLLKDRPMQRTLRFCLFNLEELGLVGSRAYVQSIEDEIKGRLISPPDDAPPDAKPRRERPAKKFVGMVSIDGVGYFTDEPNSQQSPLPATEFFKPPTVGDFLAMGGILRHRTFSRALDEAMRESAPELKTVVVDFLPIAPPDLLRSDHAPFLGMGVPAVILADTANFRNPHYHQPTDTIDTLDMTRYTHVVRALVGAAYRLAGPEGADLIRLTPPPKSATPKKQMRPASDASP